MMWAQTMTDDELLRQFEECAFPFDQWNHRAHVKVAYSYLARYPFNDALQRMRAGIKRYNAANNVPPEGYHETTTQAFMRLIAVTMSAFGEKLPVADSDGFCDAHPQLMTRRALRFFYSPERLLDPRGRTEPLEPDLAPLPTLPTGDRRAGAQRTDRL